ncbi:MAG: hypothetical protein ACK5KL_00745 [Dysgonomonas sp.]|jgi:hypothetical protein|nr:hypothetical protein [Prevotella sp.]
MNKKEVIGKVSYLSAVSTTDCYKVLIALEEVLSSELKATKGTRNIFDKLYRLMTILKNK